MQTSCLLLPTKHSITNASCVVTHNEHAGAGTLPDGKIITIGGVLKSGVGGWGGVGKVSAGLPPAVPGGLPPLTLGSCIDPDSLELLPSSGMPPAGR